MSKVGQRLAGLIAVFLILTPLTALALPSGPGWSAVTPPSAGTYQITVGGASNVWALNQTTGQLWRWIGGSVWNTPIPTPVPALTSVSTARDGALWGITSGGLVNYQSATSSWATVGSPTGVTFKQISVASTYSVWAVDTNGHVWSWNGAWTDVTSPVLTPPFKFTQVSAGSDGTVMAVLTHQSVPTTHLIAYFAPSMTGPGAWNVLAPQLRGDQVAVGDLRNGWFQQGTTFLRMPDTLLAWNSLAAWSVLPPEPGTLASIAASSDSVWGIDPAGGFWRYSGSGACGTASPLGSFYLQPPYFVAMGTPTIAVGSSLTTSISVTHVGGFDDFLTLTATGVPTGATVTFPMNPVGAGAAAMTITLSPRMQPGDYSFTVIATSGTTSQSVVVSFKLKRRVVGYFPNWKIYAPATYWPKNIDTSGSATKLSHINYAFANVVLDPVTNQWRCQVTDPWGDYQKVLPITDPNWLGGTDHPSVHGAWNEMMKLKARYPSLKVLISVGGWTLSDGFYSAATAANRVAFVSNCIDTFIKGNIPAVTVNGVSNPALPPAAAAGLFDGIDIDWEYPGTCGNNAACGAGPGNAADFAALMQEFRTQMNTLTLSTQKEYLLTAAMSAAYNVYQPPNIDVAATAPWVDFFNLMAYDFQGPWSPVANLHAPLYNPPGNVGNPNYNADFAVQDYLSYLAAATPPQPTTKLVLGTPFYGYNWTSVPPGGGGTGLYQTGVGGTSLNYSAIKPIVAGAGWTSYLLAGTAYSYNPTTHVFWTYDNPTALNTKGTYVKTKGLGGGMFWELSGDTTTGELITALAGAL